MLKKNHTIIEYQRILSISLNTVWKTILNLTSYDTKIHDKQNVIIQHFNKINVGFHNVQF